MERGLRLAHALARAGTLIGGGLLLLAAIIIGVDIILRSLFDRTVGGADELSGYALAIASSWGLSFALLNRAHIRIDSLYVLLPTKVRVFLDLLGLAGFALFMALVTWYAVGVLRQSIESNTHSISALSTPLVLPQAIWVLGFIFFMVVIGLLLVRTLRAMVAGDFGAVFRLIGSKAVLEEIEEERPLPPADRMADESDG
jgi:TRAP-type C4-dicarboxylate transport system permease small subunit